MKIEIDEQIADATDKAEKWYNALSFEFHWDFADADKEKLRDALISAYLHGYLEGKRR